MKNVKLYSGLCALVLSGSVLLLTGCGNEQSVGIEESDTPTVEESTIEQTTPQEVFETNQTFENENQLVEFFEKGEQKLYEIEHGETTQKMKDTLYHASVTLGDFILEDGSIGGYTWDELSDSTKNVILNIADEIDRFLVKYVPEQKEWVIEKWQLFKDKTSQIVKDVVGEENYEFWGDKKDEWMGQAKDLYQEGKAKVKDKYQEWKSSHE